MKRKMFFIILFFLLLMPTEVYAANNVSISCDKTKLKANEETSCRLNLSNLNFTAIDVSGSLNLGGNLSIVSSSYDRDVWLSLDNSFDIKSINLIRHTNTFSSNLTIATFKIKASANASGSSVINFNNILVGNSDYQSVSLNCSPLNISFGNNVNTLSSLTVSGNNIDFSSDKTSYSINTDNDSITINATLTDSNATVSGTGNKKVNYGNNVFDIVVEAENGLEKKYSINVYRKDNRSSVNNLSKINLSNGKITFDKDNTDYVINVEHSVTNFEISYELEDSKSYAELIGDNNLSVGENVFVIKVTAENGNVKEYKIKVIRREDPALKKGFDIKIKGYNIDFDKNIYEYFIKTKDSKLDIEVITDENIVSYDILGNDNLKDDSVIWIIASDKDGKNSKYKIVIDGLTENLKDNKDNKFFDVILFISGLLNIVLIVLAILKRKDLFKKQL